MAATKTNLKSALVRAERLERDLRAMLGGNYKAKDEQLMIRLRAAREGASSIRYLLESAVEMKR